MIKESHKISIDKDISTIFDFINDDSKLHTWVNGIVSIEPIGTHTGGIGDSVLIKVNIPNDAEITSTLIEYEKPTRMSIKYSSNGMNGKMSYDLEDLGNSTELKVMAQHNAQGIFMKILSPIIGFVIKKERKKELIRLKKVIEALD